MRTLISILLALSLLSPVHAARLFDGTNDSLQAASVDLSSYNTITVAFWLYWDAFANDDDLGMELTSDSDSFSTGFLIDPNQNLGSFVLQLLGDIGWNQALYARPSAAAWHHYVAIFDKSQATNEVDLYIDGSLQTPSSRPVTADNTNNFGNDTLNFMSRNNATLFGAGRLAEFAIWGGVVLGQNEITTLFKGFTPPCVRRTSLVSYWPSIGRTSPEVELRQAKNATVTGAVVTEHPRIVQCQ